MTGGSSALGMSRTLRRGSYQLDLTSVAFDATRIDSVRWPVTARSHRLQAQRADCEFEGHLLQGWNLHSKPWATLGRACCCQPTADTVWLFSDRRHRQDPTAALGAMSLLTVDGADVEGALVEATSSSCCESLGGFSALPA
eukprot:CAMPEP_0206423162 /NCGR_PEP_ID=MMETSP0324_2-20121206/2526_1 /ASSEMBLY_ACC=CAM_ASM_000836 /TAXON_ID=2866 /ORGANISM="Crypthecodinium cohnii, Strain Seligo" /LENGTH=140 /DNA_ID=CAMNT_0053887689 /DNA_START=367 /DNA_END=790 /DNA_ORIENTATION=-